MKITYRINDSNGTKMIYCVEIPDAELSKCRNYEEKKCLLEKYVIDDLTDKYNNEIDIISHKSKMCDFPKERKVDKIKRLAEVEFERKNIINVMSTLNIGGRSYEEQKQMAIDYAIAKYDHEIAKRKLEDEILNK